MPRRKKVEAETENAETNRLRPETKKSVLAVICLGVAMFFIFAAFEKAGPVGNTIQKVFNGLFGWGYYLLPTIFAMMAFSFITSVQKRIIGITVL